jgi:preprotein translocase subunit SecB
MALSASSQLKLNKIYMTDLSLMTKFPGEKQRVHLDRHSFDILHEVFRSEEKDGSFDFLVNVNIKVNIEEKPGYVISIGIVGEFTLNKGASMNENTEAGFVLGSALPMVINSSRVYLMNVTSYYPFGPYSLPVVDMGLLLKKNEVESKHD